MEFLFTVYTTGIHNGRGEDRYMMNQPAMQFKATPLDAKKRLFDSGYYLQSETGIFDEGDQRPFVSEFWTTTSETSNEDDVPDRLSILLPAHQYVRIFPNARFEQLLITRSPAIAGGRRRASRKRSTRRRSHRR